MKNKKNNLGIVIQARMKSSRLPGKVLMGFCGKPMLQFQIDILRHYELPYPIITATSENQLDDSLETFCRRNSIPCVRGSEEDVFGRFCHVAQEFDFDHIVRLTGDNPLTHYGILKACIQGHLEAVPDLTSTRRIRTDGSIERFVPKGHSVDVINCETLLSIGSSSLSDFEKEHVIPVFFKRKYHVCYIKDIKISPTSLSVDDIEDFDRVAAYVGNLLDKGTLFQKLGYDRKKSYCERAKMKINQLPLVTVYITNYNYAKYLEKAIKSVLKQTFQDFELLVIDDGSTDESPEVLDRYEGHGKMFIIRQSNQGLNKASNVALKLGRGKYIMRLDADDFLDPHALEVMVRELERRPECALVFPDYYLVDEEDNIIEQIRRHDFDKEVSLFDQPAHGACTLIRRSVLSRLGGYDEEFRCQDCYDIWLKLISGHKAVNVNLPLFHYRQHDKNLTKNDHFLLRTRAAIKARHVENLATRSPKVIAILPVRGRSMDPRSLPLGRLGEKRLIDWSLEAALESKYVSDVLVSTPDPDVQDYIRDNYQGRVLVFERSREMARINSPLEPSLLETLRYYSSENEEPDILAILFIEAPFRTGRYIDKAVDTMRIYEVEVLDGIREEDDIFYFHDGDGLKPWKFNSGLRLERENLYRRVGGLHLIRRAFLEKERNLLRGKIGHIVFDERAAFTIRSEMDWQVAQFLAAQKEL